jgi:hypothetical protein
MKMNRHWCIVVLVVCLFRNVGCAEIRIVDGDAFVMGVGQQKKVCLGLKCRPIPLDFGQRLADLVLAVSQERPLNEVDLRRIVDHVAEARKVIDVSGKVKKKGGSLSVVYLAIDSAFKPIVGVFELRLGMAKVEILKNLREPVICDSCVVVYRSMLNDSLLTQ